GNRGGGGRRGLRGAAFGGHPRAAPGLEGLAARQVPPGHGSRSFRHYPIAPSSVWRPRALRGRASVGPRGGQCRRRAAANASADAAALCCLAWALRCAACALGAQGPGQLRRLAPENAAAPLCGGLSAAARGAGTFGLGLSGIPGPQPAGAAAAAGRPRGTSP
ncbi:unnamed protein product, partial [Effrenium voratum]